MSHVFSFLLAQALPYVTPSAPVAVTYDPVRAHLLTSTDYAILAAVALPMAFLAGTVLREQRRYGLSPRERQERRDRFDPLVWVNTQSRIYYFEGERWYKRTREGLMLPLRIAQARGNRAAKGTTPAWKNGKPTATARSFRTT